MTKDDQIIRMLKEIMSTLDSHTSILDDHTKKLDNHTNKLDSHTKKLDSHTKKLDDHTKKLDDHTKKLDDHSKKLDHHTLTLEEHGNMLSALRTGQEHLKAQIEGMKISNAKEFGKLNERMDTVSDHIELLRDESWEQKTDIHRIKKTMGMR